MSNFTNFRGWIERLGFQRNDPPPTIYAVQPVRIVGDDSGLIPPIRPPAFWIGGHTGAISGIQNALIVIRSIAAGGTWVRGLTVSPIGSGASVMQSRIAPINTLTFSGSPNGSVLTNETGFEAGDTVAFSGIDAAFVESDNLPRTSCPSNDVARFPDLFIPNGEELGIQSITVDVELGWQAHVEEVPVERLAASSS